MKLGKLKSGDRIALVWNVLHYRAFSYLFLDEPNETFKTVTGSRESIISSLAVLVDGGYLEWGIHLALLLCGQLNEESHQDYE